MADIVQVLVAVLVMLSFVGGKVTNWEVKTRRNRFKI